MSVVAASSRSGFGASVLWFASVYSVISVVLAGVEAIVAPGVVGSTLLALFTVQVVSGVAAGRSEARQLPSHGARALLAASYVGVAIVVQLAISVAASLSGLKFGLMAPDFSNVSRQTAQLIFVAMILLNVTAWFAMAWSAIEIHGRRGKTQ